MSTPTWKTPERIVHTMSTEILHHYRCGKCGLWWSVADETNEHETRHCPHCGAHGYVESVE